ncbi:hypothetical protein C8F01DRAFT_1108631 [Mycena amicta]|nr:hypothetical protein C8F01DRAFT_1108631 [Mycena amicta]
MDGSWSSPSYALPRIHSPTPYNEDYRLSWDPPADSKVSLPSFRSLFAAPSDDEEHPLASEYDEYSDPEPETAHDDFLTDSDDEQHSYFSNAHIRFNISAERGRWKSDPMPRHAVLRISARTTSPAPSPAPSVVVQRTHRNISEPAPTTSSPLDASPEPQVPLSSSPILRHSSPVLSPISFSVSPESVSPLSAVEPFSPLSLPPSSLAGDHELDMLSDDHAPSESETGLGLFVSSIALVWPLIQLTFAQAIPSPDLSGVADSTSINAIEAEAEALVSSATVEDHVAQAPTHEESSDEFDMPGPKKAAKPRDGNGSMRRKPKKARIAEPPTHQSRPIGSRRTRPSDQKDTTRRKDSNAKSSRTAGRNAPLTSQKAKAKKSRRRSPPPPPPEIDPELCGMLIECLATSRASSLPTSALFKSIMQSYPSVKTRGTEQECLELMERVLESGTSAAGGSGVFGKVERENTVRHLLQCFRLGSGYAQDVSDHSFEEQWFYLSERDPDQDRAQLFVSFRPAKRTETKKYKQYFYRPLGKISRWDAEDAL